MEETYPASIEGRQSIRIIPRVEGYLQEIKVKEGQRVRKGQVLFILDQASYVADEKAAKANVEVAKVLEADVVCWERFSVAGTALIPKRFLLFLY